MARSDACKRERSELRGIPACLNREIYKNDNCEGKMRRGFQILENSNNEYARKIETTDFPENSVRRSRDVKIKGSIK